MRATAPRAKTTGGRPSGWQSVARTDSARSVSAQTGCGISNGLSGRRRLRSQCRDQWGLPSVLLARPGEALSADAHARTSGAAARLCGSICCAPF
eukprot:scaffold81991_cov72-Phaeocystis_antarctica.AAC.18